MEENSKGVGQWKLKGDKSAKVKTENSLLDLATVAGGLAMAVAPWKRKLGHFRMEHAWEQGEILPLCATS